MRKNKPVTFKMVWLSLGWFRKDYLEVLLACPDEVPWCCHTNARMELARARYAELMGEGVGGESQEPQTAPPTPLPDSK